MQLDRWRHLASVALVSVLAACTTAPPSAAPEASLAGVPTSAPVSSATPTTTPTEVAAPAQAPTPTPSTPLGGGPLVVCQLYDVVVDKAKTESVFTLDLGTGERTKIGSIQRG